MNRLWAKRLILIVLGIGLGLVAIEAALRVGRFTLHQTGHRANWAEDVEGRVILCVGDSHTYATSIPREHAYPAQLQAYLDRVDPEGRYTVVNRGVPGMNSSQLAYVLPSWLRQYRPDFVVVWVGANNIWNREDPAQLRSSEVERSGIGRALSWSLLYRLWLNLRADSLPAGASEDAETFMEESLRRSHLWLREDRLSDSEILTSRPLISRSLLTFSRIQVGSGSYSRIRKVIFGKGNIQSRTGTRSYTRKLRKWRRKRVESRSSTL